MKSDALSMTRPPLEWKVGLFVLIGLVLLAVLLIEFSKGANVFKPTNTLYVQAPTVGGLTVSASVLMSGVKVGNVKSIILAPDGKSVTITLSIYKEAKIHDDARFVIEQSGFLGDQYVAILPTANKGSVFKDGDHASAEAPFDLQEVARAAGGFVQRVDETVKKLNEIIDRLQKYLLNEQTMTNFSMIAGNLRASSERALATMDHLNGLVVSNTPALSQSSSNLLLFSGRINEVALNLNGVVLSNRTEIAATVKNLRDSSETLKGVLGDVQAGKGLAGALLKDQQLANNVSEVVSNLGVTTSNLNRLGVWGVLWRHKPPKAPPPSRSSLASPKTLNLPD